MEFSYKTAVINSNIPLEFYKPNLKIEGPMIDALYIPSQSHRPGLATDPSILKYHVKSLYILFSKEAATWANEIEHPNIHIVTDMLSQWKASSYALYDSARNPGNQYKPEYDIPYKRTFSLMNALENDYKYIGFLDDDIILDSEKLSITRQALGEGVDIGSFHVLDYPDVSTIDHVERIIKNKPSRVSIGGNCMFINTEAVNAFFPEAYNDDWYFILSHLGVKRIASLGQADQLPYAPWNDSNRVAFEQFGDIVIEGVKKNVLEKRNVFHGGHEYWDQIKKEYLERVNDLKTDENAMPFSDILERAYQVANDITTSSIISFVSAYCSEKSNMFKKRP